MKAAAAHPDPDALPGGADDHPSKRIEKSYAESEIEAGLLELAMVNGNRRQASERLAERGIEIPAGTLEGWMKSVHAERYQRIRADVVPRIIQEQRDEFSSLISQHNDNEAKLAEKLANELDALAPKDIGKAIQQTAVAKGINNQNAALADGRPTEIKRIEDIGDIIRAMKAEGIPLPPDMQAAYDEFYAEKAIDSTATEVTPDA